MPSNPDAEMTTDGCEHALNGWPWCNACAEIVLARISSLTATIEKLEQRICDFQAAAMITIGGDPGPVEPRHVEANVMSDNDTCRHGYALGAYDCEGDGPFSHPPFGSQPEQGRGMGRDDAIRQLEELRVMYYAGREIGFALTSEQARETRTLEATIERQRKALEEMRAAIAEYDAGMAAPGGYPEDGHVLASECVERARTALSEDWADGGTLPAVEPQSGLK